MPYQHILIATDLSEHCRALTDHALSLATPCGAQISLAHVVEPMAMAFGGDVPIDLSLVQQQQLEQAKQRLNQLIESYPEQLGAHNCHIAYGQPRPELHRIATDLNCDLIIAGSRGRHGLALLLGSTTNDLLHAAPCDVLAVRLKLEPR